jgi:hypothetical protein
MLSPEWKESLSINYPSPSGNSMEAPCLVNKTEESNWPCPPLASSEIIHLSELNGQNIPWELNQK